ncbi:MAG: transposase [Desulfobacteraceae bacterium]
MARIARVVAPLYSHHIIQRGNRRQQTFFNDEDYSAYLELMSEWCRTYHVEVWAYCLMPNHVHLILEPETKDGLNLAVGEAHKRYTRRINSREGWCGHLWQGRFASFIMDDSYLLSCTKYIELNPVRAGLVKKPEQWAWSSTRAHINGKDDILIRPKTLTDRINKPWKKFLSTDVQDHEMDLFRKHERTGRPIGDDSFIDHLEYLLDRTLKPQKPGPKCQNPNVKRDGRKSSGIS